MNELTKDQWKRSMSTGFGDKDHPINYNNIHHDTLVVQLENSEMAMSDVTKIIKYSQMLQDMFSINDNLEDWVKAKLNHACDYVDTVRDYLKFYRDEKNPIDELYNEAVVLNKKYKDVDKIVDAIQYTLDIVGLEPTIGSIADGSNAIISLLRAALSKETDESKKHLLNAAISAVSVIPFGDLVKLIKLRVLRKPAVKLLKFVKKYLKSTGPSYADDLLEKWSNSYKKRINCNDPRGFSQKAHCRARKLRQSGQSTSSKPVKEIYKEVVGQLLKEYNSSMAMGALKQLNNDSKELAHMLEPEMNLEDWVKAKLNLAGEYLDDVYHHLDHFGPDGRKLDEFTKIKEGWKDWVTAGAIGLSALKGGDLNASKPIDVSTQIKRDSVAKVAPVSKLDVSLDQSFIDYIKTVENAGKTGYNKQKKLWFPHKSFEGGSDTIGYGHKIQKGEDFSKGITDSQAEDLLKKDLEKAKKQVYNELGNRQMSKKQLEMFVDFVFNMGTLKKFPKFTAAALKNDEKTMKDQYKRYTGGKELKGRNDAFVRRFLSENLNELDYESGVGIHELMMFYAKASQDECDQLEGCMKDQNVQCVKSLITKVTGMTIDKIQEGFYDGSKNAWLSPSGKLIDIETGKFPFSDHATWAVINVLAESDPEYAVAKDKDVDWVYNKYSGKTSIYTTMVEYGYIRCIIMVNARKIYLDFADHTNEWRKYFSKSQASFIIKYAINKEYKVIVDNIEKVLYEPPTPEDIS